MPLWLLKNEVYTELLKVVWKRKCNLSACLIYLVYQIRRKTSKNRLRSKDNENTLATCNNQNGGNTFRCRTPY